MLKQKLVFGLSAKLIIQVIQIISTILVARLAGPSVLGTLTFGLSYVSMIYFLSQFGFGSAHVKIINEGKPIENCIGTYSRLIIYNLLLFIVVFFLCLIFQLYVFKVPFETKSHLYVVFVFFIVQIINGLLAIPNGTFVAFTQQAKQDIPQLISNAVGYLSRIILVILGVNVVGLSLTSLLAAIVIIPITLRYYRDYPKGIYDKKLAKRYIHISITFFFLTTVQSLTHYTDKVFLQFFTSSDQVGLYGASFRLASVITMIGSNMGLLFFPLFAKAFSEGNMDYIRDKVMLYDKYSLLFIFPIIILIMIYSDSILYYILGKKFIGATVSMAIGSLALYVRMHFTPYNNILTGAGKFKAMVWINVIMSVVYLILLIVLIHPKLAGWGINGAATAMLISNTLLSIVTVIYNSKFLKNIKPLKHVKLALFIIGYSLPMWFFYNKFKGGYNNYIMRFSFPVIYIIGLALCLFITKNLRKEDVDILKQLLSLNKMKQYVKQEVLQND